MGKPSPSLSRRQMRAFDRRAIDHWGVPGVVLMENAGRGVTDAIEEVLGGLAGRRVAVVAGRGNNAGDGFVIARHVRVRAGESVVFLVADPAGLAADAATNFALLAHVGVEVRRRAGDALADLGEELSGFDLVVDALGGTGITGALRGDLAAAVEAINAAGRPVVAVDIPTGLDCDSGEAPGATVKADLTVTMAARKTGFDAPGAAAHTGDVRVVDIGVPPPGQRSDSS